MSSESKHLSEKKTKNTPVGTLGWHSLCYCHIILPNVLYCWFFSDTKPIWTTFPSDRDMEFCLQECVNGQCDTDAITGIPECRCSPGFYLLNRNCTGESWIFCFPKKFENNFFIFPHPLFYFCTIWISLLVPHIFSEFWIEFWFYWSLLNKIRISVNTGAYNHCEKRKHFRASLLSLDKTQTVNILDLNPYKFIFGAGKLKNLKLFTWRENKTPFPIWSFVFHAVIGRCIISNYKRYFLSDREGHGHWAVLYKSSSRH